MIPTETGPVEAVVQPKSYNSFTGAFALILLLVNVSMFAFGMQMSGWGVLGMSVVVSPIVNGVFLLGGLVVSIVQRAQKGPGAGQAVGGGVFAAHSGGCALRYAHALFRANQWLLREVMNAKL